MVFKVATTRAISQGLFIYDSPANALRGLETTPYLYLAKRDFVDQTDVDAFVTARGGDTSGRIWLLLDMGAAGVL